MMAAILLASMVLICISGYGLGALHRCPDCKTNAADRKSITSELSAVVKRNMAFYSALQKAETFVAEELETRTASFLPNPDAGEGGYLADAQETLDAIRAALKSGVGA